MKSLYLRIYLTLVVLLLAFAFGSGFLFQRQFEKERVRVDAAAGERLQAMATLLQRSLPPSSAPVEAQAAALLDWSVRLRIPMALDDAHGQRIATSPSFARREEDHMGRSFSARLDDERTLWIMRAGPLLRPSMAERHAAGDVPRADGSPRRDLSWRWPLPPGGYNGLTLATLLVLLFVGVALAAVPVVRRLTRRLEILQRGVEQFGAGDLNSRVAVDGEDEVARLARSFNRSADQVQALLRSHQSLLANASHELRSPLARLKMALSLSDAAGPAQREALQREIHTNIAELDALVEEVLLASRLDVQRAQDGGPAATQAVEILALAAEEAARSGAELQADEGAAAWRVMGDERLLRRALRNLLDNAKRYGGDTVTLLLQRDGERMLSLQVCDRGSGVPQAMQERIFEPFFRLPGHAEQVGGVGLGLSLVKQIAQRHQGSVRCQSREGGGSCFVLQLPLMG